MFLVWVLLLLVFAVWYLSRSLHRKLKVLLPRVPYVVTLGVIVLCVLIMLSSFFRSALPFAWMKSAAGVASAYLMGFFLYLLIFTLLIDLVLFILGKCKLSVVKTRTFLGGALAAILVLSVSVTAYGLVHFNDIKHVSYEITVEGKTDVSDLNIVLISDLHLGAVGSEERLSMIVDEINAQSPDVVCIAGDFFDTDFSAIRDPEKAIETMRGIRSTYGVYACLGNHDAGKTVTDMIDFLARANVCLLNEAYTVIDERLILVGRLDGSPIGGFDALRRGEIADILTNVDENLPVIVMDHNPKNIASYGSGVDLILSGHTHKGQLFPGSLLTGLLYEVDHGYYRNEETGVQVIVTSGIGGWGVPMRVGTDSELISITVKSR